MIRFWESEQNKLLDRNEYHIPIIAISYGEILLNQQYEAYEAGANLYLNQPNNDPLQSPLDQIHVDVTGTVIVINKLHIKFRVITTLFEGHGNFFSQGYVKKSYDRKNFDKFAKVIVKYLTKFEPGIFISPKLDEQYHQLTIDELEMLPGFTIGYEIVIQGSLLEANQVLNAVYYYAPNDTNGQVNFTIQVEDSPRSNCLLNSSNSYNESIIYYRNPQLELNSTNYLCLSNETNVVYNQILLFIIAVNHPPQIVSNLSSLTAQLNYPLLWNQLLIIDPDVNETSFTTSFGKVTMPPITIMMSTVYGRITIPNRDGLVFLQGNEVIFL
jgi:hypothetical protein